MKTFVKVLGLISLVSLAACDSKQENKVENAYDNQADALENQADNIEDKTDNIAENVTAAGDNMSDALKEKAEAKRKAGNVAAEKVENHM